MILIKMLVFLRHGEKVHDNHAVTQFPYDSQITQQSIVRARAWFETLKTRYGSPVRIVSSSFRRTRKTASIAEEVFGVKVTVDPRVGEYLGAHSYVNVMRGVTRATREHGVSVTKDPEFRVMLRGFLADLKDPVDGWVLVVSHSHTIWTVADLLGGTVPHPIDLEGIAVEAGVVRSIAIEQ